MISLLLTLMIIVNSLTLNISVFAENDTVLMDNYIADVIPKYLSANNLYSENLSISQPFTPYLYDDGSICDNEQYYFITDDENIVAILEVYNDNQNFSSFFEELDCDLLDTAFRTNDEIALVYYDERLLFDYNDSLYEFTGEILNVSFIPQNSYSIIAQHSVFAGVSSRESCMFSKKLNVDIIPNKTINGKGMCWASCCASKINYQQDKWQFNDVEGIYFYACMGYQGTKGGYEECIMYVYNIYLSGDIVSLADNAAHLTPSDISTLISKGKPIHIGIFPSSGSGHSLMICGISMYTNYCILTIMDPNKSSYVTKTISCTPNSSIDFTYSVYNEWRYSRF